MSICSGSMIPDTNVGGNIAAISEVSDDQETTVCWAKGGAIAAKAIWPPLKR